MLKRGISLVAPILLTLCAVVWQPSVAHAACIIGKTSFSDGGYATPGTWYYYDVKSGPPNTSGTLWVSRNYQPWEVTPGWLQTDSNGDARKGPWTPTYDEYAVAFIAWPNGCTTDTATHVNDV